MVVVLLIFGDQVPMIPLFDVVGKSGIKLPLQYEFTTVKVGMLIGVTFIVKLDVVEHWFELGVKV